MENSISSDLIRGHIDTIILYSLVDNDKFAQQISDSIFEKSQNKYEINQATLYSSLKRLEKLNYVKAYWFDACGGRRRFFKLTDDGRDFIDKNLSSWNFSRSIIDKLLSNPPSENKIEFLKKDQVNVDEVQNSSTLSKTDENICDEKIEINTQNINFQPQNNEVVNEKPIAVEKSIDKKDTFLDEPVKEVSEKDSLSIEKEINFRNILNGLIKVTKIVEKDAEIAEVVNEEKQKDLSNVISSSHKTNQKYSIDFSNLEINAEREGYKIRFSNSKPIAKKGKILINQLLFYSSILTSIVIFSEFVLFLSFYSKYLEATTPIFIVGYSLTFIPLAFFFIKYLLNKDKRVKTLKNNELISLLIVFFDFILLLFVFEWILGLDFTNTFDLVCYYLLPCAVIFDLLVFAAFKLVLSKTKLFKTNKNI